MGLFGLKIMSTAVLDKILDDRQESRDLAQERSMLARDMGKRVTELEQTIATLQKKVEVFEKADAARPHLTALIEQGKKSRWRFKIMSDDDIIAMPPIRGYGEKAEAEAMVQLLSEAKIEVTNDD